MFWDRVDSVEHIGLEPVLPGESGCEGCIAPCCWNVKLLHFQASAWTDLEYVHFLSGFPEIEIAYRERGEFRFFYRRPCRFLDTETGRFDCTRHGTEDKPRICVDFDENGCWYRGALLGTPRVGVPVVRLDQRRFHVLAKLFETDARGAITRFPEPLEAWEAIQAQAPNPAPAVAVPPVASADLGVEPTETTPYWPRSSPCDSCTAPCCRALLFDRRPPSGRESIDFMRYQAGFDGLEIAVNSSGWRTLVRTRCSHLVDGRCSLFGQPERPTLCSGYNQYTCDYRRFFAAGPDEVLRLGLDDIIALQGADPFDEAGELPKAFGFAQVRRLLADDTR